jgi:hypothetical protein
MLLKWSSVSCGVLAYEFLEADTESARRALIEKWRADIARAKDDVEYTPHIVLTHASLPSLIADDIAFLRVNRGRVTALAKAIAKAASPMEFWDVKDVAGDLATPSTRTLTAAEREAAPYWSELNRLVNEAYQVRPGVYDLPDESERVPRPPAELADDAGTGYWQNGRLSIKGATARPQTADFLIRQGYLKAAPAGPFVRGELTDAGRGLIESDDPRIIEAFLASALRQIDELTSGGTESALRRVDSGTPEHLREH